MCTRFQPAVLASFAPWARVRGVGALFRNRQAALLTFSFLRELRMAGSICPPA